MANNGRGQKMHEVEARGAAAAANNVVQFRLLDIYICLNGSVEGKRCMLVCSKTRCKIKKPSLILNTELSARCFFLPVWHASRVRLHTTRGRKCKLVSDANCTLLHYSPQRQQPWPAPCPCFASPIHVALPKSQQLTVESARCSNW